MRVLVINEQAPVKWEEMEQYDVVFKLCTILGKHYRLIRDKNSTLFGHNGIRWFSECWLTELEFNKFIEDHILELL